MFNGNLSFTKAGPAVAFADISAMRSNVGAQLTNITIPAASDGNGGMAMFNSPGQDSGTKNLQRGGKFLFEGFSTTQSALRIETDPSWLNDFGTHPRTSDSLNVLILEQSPLVPNTGVQSEREGLRMTSIDYLFGLIESDAESLSFDFELEELSDQKDSIRNWGSGYRFRIPLN